MLKNNALLSNKTIVIIGGAGLLGRVFADSLLAQKANVVIADLNLEAGNEVCEYLQKKHKNSVISTEIVDITSKESLLDLIGRICKARGSIDAVVNNAYPHNKNYGRSLDEVEYQDFCENINLHLGGYFLSTQQFAKLFKRQKFGQVINISSIYGCIAPRFDIYDGTSMTMPVEYAAIKAAIQHLSLYFMRYYKGTNIRFNCIAPGGIKDSQSMQFIKNYEKYSQSKGMLDPEDICGALIFLLSDMAQYINGQTIIVDDGWTA